MSFSKNIKRIFIIGLIAGIMAVPVPVLAATTAKVKDVAGTGTPGYNDGAAAEALFNYPYGLASDKNGGIIIVDSYNNRIRLLKDNKVTTLAGYTDRTQVNGLPEGSLIDGDALQAGFNHPRGVAVDSKGNIIISDSENNVIRILTNGKVYTLAGELAAGYTDAKGNKAQFNLPSGMAIDSMDNLYVADTLNHVIRKITAKGEVTTFAGKAGSDGGYKDGAAAEALFNEPSDVAIDQSGTIYVMDSGNQLVRMIKNGKVSTVAGTATEKITNTPYVKGDFQNGKASKAKFNFPMGIDVAPDGTIFIADTYNHRIRVIKKDGTVHTLAGNGIPGFVSGYADTAEFNGPSGILYDNGTLYISDTNNSNLRSLKVNLKKLNIVEDRIDLENSYHFDAATDELQIWYEGSKIKLADTKAYKEWDTIYLPLNEVMKAWGAKVKWVKKDQQLSVTRKGFKHVFTIGKDTTFLKDGAVYIDTTSLSELTKLRIEWYPEHAALVIEKRN